jgi:hypothetical protein
MNVEEEVLEVDLVVEVEEGLEEAAEEGPQVEEVTVLLDPLSLRMELRVNMDRDNRNEFSLAWFMISALYGEGYIITSFGRLW